MPERKDNLGNLPYPENIPLWWRTPGSDTLEDSRPSRAFGNLTLTEAMTAISRLLKVHQASYLISPRDPKIVVFPYAFIPLQEGDGLINLSTQESYEVDQVLLNPETGAWEGAVKLTAEVPPKRLDLEVLRPADESRWVRFDHAWPPNLAGQLDPGSPVPDIDPTITWTTNTIEPAGMNKPFESRKQFGGRLREVVPDPLISNRSIEIRGQLFDCLVHFETWGSSQLVAEKLASWFRFFMDRNTPLLRALGVGKMQFWRQLRSKEDLAWRQPLPTRTLEWYFQIEELTFHHEWNINHIKVGIQAADTVSRLRPSRVVANQTLKAGYTVEDYRKLFLDEDGNRVFTTVDI